ncbi:hypothetical protein [Nocardia cerradoensis]|uniref:Uncharacterized protein n=1 Tax=Nocardia cerradoensis TaxID=85688 RepID=A0A231GTV1_9NOCA|nr:hypothetical protein [Nocardia cerradoensis]NKY48005.1 hypothetical protein [Nocardia cerradoensis]OXR39911.1 hypothetical protein B7C42_08016 [Nocardia cerradoensis]
MPITITAEILPGKVDTNATAEFNNTNRADQYARILIDTGDYKSGGVWLTDTNGDRHRLDPAPLAGESITPYYAIEISHDGRVEITSSGQTVVRVTPEIAVRFGERLRAAGIAGMTKSYGYPGAQFGRH